VPPAPSLPAAPPLSSTERSGASAGSIRTRLAVIGGIVGVALYILLVVASFATGGSEEGYWALALFFGMIVLTVVLMIVGGVLVAFQQTRSFAIGLLIAIAIGVFISGGVCVAALSTTG
jgi:Na+/melibiose symporter-like transporter